MSIALGRAAECLFNRDQLVLGDGCAKDGGSRCLRCGTCRERRKSRARANLLLRKLVPNAIHGNDRDMKRIVESANVSLHSAESLARHAFCLVWRSGACGSARNALVSQPGKVTGAQRQAQSRGISHITYGSPDDSHSCTAFPISTTPPVAKRHMSCDTFWRGSYMVRLGSLPRTNSARLRTCAALHAHKNLNPSRLVGAVREQSKPHPTNRITHQPCQRHLHQRENPRARPADPLSARRRLLALAFNPSPINSALMTRRPNLAPSPSRGGGINARREGTMPIRMTRNRRRMRRH